MKRLSKDILRFGLGATFLWIGVLIWQDPIAWGGFIRPWVLKLLPIPLKEAMVGNALLDMVIGACFIINPLVFLASVLGVFHLATVLIVSGVNEATVRDIGLLAAALALVAETWPDKYKFWVKK